MRTPLLILCLIQAAPIHGQDGIAKTRSFPESKCQYTLPAGWKWIDEKKTHQIIISAQSADGKLKLILMSEPTTAIDMSPRTQAAIESNYYKAAPTLVRRGTTQTTLGGLTALQINAGRGNGQATLATRSTLANGKLYSVIIVGPGQPPVEQQLGFETAMSGFQFIGTPDTTNNRNAVIAVLAVGFVVLVGIGILIALVIKLATGQKRPRRKRRLREEESDDDDERPRRRR